MADGYLKIKTKLDNSGISKDVQKLNNELNKIEVENTDLSQEQRELEEEISQYERLNAEAEQYRQKLKQLEQERSSLTTGGLKDADSSRYSAINSELSSIQSQYDSITSKIESQTTHIEEVYAKLDKVKSKQEENNQKAQEFKDKIEQINLKKVETQIDNVGSSITKSITKIGKMTMAVFGIRTAWNAVNKAISLAKQYDSQIATDFEYLGYCLAQLVIPLVQKLVNLIYKILSYINAITTAWFGINLFANSSVSAFQAIADSASSAADSVNEMQKQTQGFDEMNIMADTSSSSSGSSGGSGGSSGSTATPSTDLSMSDIEIPTWLQWIMDNKEEILSLLAGVASAILLIKFGLEGIKALGIGIAIASVVYTIQSLLDYLEDPSWTNFGKIIQGIGGTILGIGLAIGSVPAIIVGAIVLAVGTVIKYWDEIKAFFQEGIDWLSSKSEWVHTMFGDTFGNIYDAIVQILQGILNIFDSVFTSIKGVFDGLIQFVKGVFSGDWESAWEGVKTILTSLLEGLIGIVEALGNDIIMGLLNGILSLIEGIEGWINEHIVQPFINGFKKLFGINSPSTVMAELGKYLIQGLFNGLSNIWETIKCIFESLLSNVKSIFETMKSTITTIINAIKTKISDVFNSIKNTLSNIWNSIKTNISNSITSIKNSIVNTFTSAYNSVTSLFSRLKSFFSNIWSSIKTTFTNLGTSIGSAISNAVKSGINNVITLIQNTINKAINLINGAIGVINLLPGVNVSKISTLSLPRLARGGIVNQPTQAIVGEAGKEAVLPLENNTEWMDTLANKLASKISVNNNSAPYIIKVDSRTLKRGIAQQSKNLAFETNGGVS